MRWALLVFLLISCTDNTEEEMKLFISGLSESQASPPLEVENKFSYETTIANWDVYNNSFPSMNEVNDRLYSTWRRGMYHADAPGVIYSSYSDDDGENWSANAPVYDGQEIRTIFPEIFIEYPNSEVDVRDPNIMDLGNGTLLLSGFITVSEYLDGDPIYSWTVYYRINYYRLLSINGNTVDWDNPLNTFYVRDGVAPYGRPKYGQVDLYQGYLYATNYDLDGNTFIYRSNDMGYTWEQTGQNLIADGFAGNETAMVRLGTTLTSLTRNKIEDSGGAQHSIFSESNDNGVTWTGHVSSGGTLQGQYGVVVGDDVIAYSGRDNEDRDTNDVFSTIRVYRWSTKELLSELVYWDDSGNINDQGYSNLIKYRDRYFLIYYKGQYGIYNKTGVYFRQLVYDADTYTFSFPND